MGQALGVTELFWESSLGLVQGGLGLVQGDQGLVGGLGPVEGPRGTFGSSLHSVAPLPTLPWQFVGRWRSRVYPPELHKGGRGQFVFRSCV